jgi:hypothetical protein
MVAARRRNDGFEVADERDTIPTDAMTDETSTTKTQRDSHEVLLHASPITPILRKPPLLDACVAGAGGDKHLNEPFNDPSFG